MTAEQWARRPCPELRPAPQELLENETIRAWLAQRSDDDPH